MNKYLRYLDKMYQNNPTLDERGFYSLLIYYNIENKKINHYFDRWIKRFAEHKNISVFVDNNWRYFCQFVNYDDNTYDKLIKLYIPLKEECIYKGANLIFDYLERIGIKHLSKIGSDQRNDDIVIRVNSVNDAKTIINFVKDNKFLKKALLPTNPFTFNQDGVGLALDGDLSYNSELSKMLYRYISDRKKQNIQTPPNVEEFSNYLYDVLINTKNRDLFIIYKTIYANIVKSEFGFNNYVDLVNEYQNNQELIFKALITTKKKYDEKQMLSALFGMLDEDYSFITNDSLMRDNARKYLSSNQVISIINQVCGYNKNRMIDKNAIAEFINCVEAYEKEQNEKYSYIIANAVKETAKKNGYDDIGKIKSLIIQFLFTKEIRLFTRDNSARESIEKIIYTVNDINEALRQELGLNNEARVYEITNAIIRKEFIMEDNKKK